MVTLQEYLEKKYPTKEERAKVKEIDISEINEERGSRLEGGELDLREFKNVDWVCIVDNPLNSKLTKLNVSGLVNLTELNCSNNNLTSLDVSGCVNLTKLYCSNNNLTSIDFLNQLPHPEKLTGLQLANNNIEPTNLEFLRPFINLTEKLALGNDDYEKLYNNNIYNRFYGSLEPLRNMTKLSGLCIDGTDIEEGNEYLPVSISKDDFHCSPTLPNQKVAKIQNELRPFNYDIKAWQLANPAKMVKVWKEKYQDKEKLIKDLETKITQTQAELTHTKTQESDKTAKISRLESKLKLLEDTKTKLEKELAQEQQQHNQTKTNFQSQLRDLATILFPSNSDINNLSFSVLKEQAEKVKGQNQAQEQQITNLQEALAKEEKHRQRNYESAKEEAEKVKIKNEELKLAQEKIKELEKTLTQLEQEKGQLITTHQATITNLQGQIEIKKGELQSQEQAKTNLINQFKKEKQTLKAQNSQALTEQKEFYLEKVKGLGDQIKELKLQLTQLEQTKTTELKDFKEQVKVKLTQIKETHQKIVQVYQA